MGAMVNDERGMQRIRKGNPVEIVNGEMMLGTSNDDETDWEKSQIY